jgi:hypothetical protein
MMHKKFRQSLKNRPEMEEIFKETLETLADIYLKNDGKLTFETINKELGKRARKENILTKEENGYDMIRIGLDSTCYYRIIVDIGALPGKEIDFQKQPLIYFIGNKYESDQFMASRKDYPARRNKAMTDGRANLFKILLGENYIGNGNGDANSA